MMRWSTHSLRAKVFLGLVSVLVGTLAVASALAYLQFRQGEQDRWSEQSVQYRNSLRRLLELEADALASKGKALSMAPVLRAVMESRHGPTIEDSLASFRESLKLEYLGAFSGDGARLGGSGLSGVDLLQRLPSAAARALTGESAERSGVVSSGAEAYLVAFAPVDSGAERVGGLLLAKRLQVDELGARLAGSGVRLEFLHGSGAQAGEPSVEIPGFIEGSPLRIGLSLENPGAVERFRQFRIVGVVMALFVFAASMLFTVPFSRMVSAPLVALSRLTRQISESPERIATQRLPPLSGGLEVAELSRSVNRFLDEISRRQELLEKANQQLESRVSERTRSLEESLERLRETQAQLAYSSKMSALGEMAGGVAHEINNPLAIIQVNAEQIQELLGSFDAATLPMLQERSGKVVATVGRIAKIVSGLRTISRDAGGDPFVTVGAAALARDALALCRERLRNHGVAIRELYESEAVTVHCRPAQIAQVLLNLLSNAGDAAAAGAERWVELSVRQAGELCEFAVCDSGNGVPEPIREKIFQPFFTTKAVGSGTGLGLSVSLGIAKAHGGSLTLDASCSHTRFVLKQASSAPVGRA